MRYEIKNNRISYDLVVIDKAAFSFPSISKLKSGLNQKSDLAYKLNGVYAFLRNTKIERWVGPMAGVGFSSSLVHKMFSSASQTLCDNNKECHASLLQNFPQAGVWFCDCKDAYFLRSLKLFDCCFFDHSHFTLNKKEELDCFRAYLKKPTNIFIYTDVFPYSLKPFNTDKFLNYLGRVHDFLQEHGWYLDAWYLYPSHNVVMIKAVRCKVKMKQILLDDTEGFSIRKIEGFEF
jgi:hypothetical protein